MLAVLLIYVDALFGRPRCGLAQPPRKADDIMHLLSIHIVSLLHHLNKKMGRSFRYCSLSHYGSSWLDVKPVHRRNILWRTRLFSAFIYIFEISRSY